MLDRGLGPRVLATHSPFMPRVELGLEHCDGGGFGVTRVAQKRQLVIHAGNEPVIVGKGMEHSIGV